MAVKTVKFPIFQIHLAIEEKKLTTQGQVGNQRTFRRANPAREDVAYALKKTKLLILKGRKKNILNKRSELSK